MAGTTSMSGGGATVPRQMEESQVTGWVGWIVFAGTMMAILGVFHAFEGLIALFRHSYIAFPTQGLTIQVSYTQWGWVQLVAGVLVFFAGLSLFTGRMCAVAGCNREAAAPRPATECRQVAAWVLDDERGNRRVRRAGADLVPQPKAPQ